MVAGQRPGRYQIMPAAGWALRRLEAGGQVAEPLTGDDPQEVAGYQIRARLGAGGMGRVYLAFTPGGRPVALKMIRGEFGDDEEFRARFRQEVAAAQRVHGLFTAQVLDADPDAPQPWLATSYVAGLSLREAVGGYGPLPRGTVLLLIAGIAEALQAIHAVGIIHRDLKPANVILALDGPRVIDFGIARAAAAPALTLRGLVVGSPRFMAPEQAHGEPTTPAVDVFALGSLATYAITGHPPFGTDNALVVLGRVINDPPDLAGCPPDLRPLMESCLAKDPSQRPLPGEVITACRVAAGGELAFDRSWLPTAIAAAATAATRTLPVPGTVAQEPSVTEWTFASQASKFGLVVTPIGSGNGSEPGEPARPSTSSGSGHPDEERPTGGTGSGRPGPGRRWTRWSGGKAMAGMASVIAVLAVAAACVSLLSTPTNGGEGPPRAPAGQAAFAGTWEGTVRQPGWMVTSWAIELVIPATGAMGRYSAPSLGCSGSFRVGSVTARIIAGRAVTTSALNPGCVATAWVTLALDGPTQLRLTWAPRRHPQKIGSAELTSRRRVPEPQDGRSSR
jgi:serine/threonine protein kinase